MKNTPRKAILPAALLAAMMLISPIQFATAADGEGRYTMTPTDDGYLRLDSQSGAVALCARTESGWSCTPVDDDQLSMQDKLAAITKENEELKDEVRELRRVLDSQIKNGGQNGSGSGSITLPSDQDVDKIIGFLEKLAKKFKGMVNELKEDQEPGTPL